MADADDEAAVLRIGTAVDQLGRLYPWLESAASARGLPVPLVQKMHVALEEAAMNVAMHAYGPDRTGEITIRLNTSPNAAALVVEDLGPAFDPTGAAAPARAQSLEHARPGGLGLTLLRHFCPDIGYEWSDGRNRLTLRFPLG
jgi:anti-sigma regulatory factor (Ser/Thr protein kinase)